MHLMTAGVPPKRDAWLNSQQTKKLLLIMKLTTLILLTACITAGAKGTAQTITLSLDRAPVQKVFKEVSKQTGISIVYSEAALKKLSPVSIHVRNATVNEVMDQCLKNQPFDYKIEGNVITVIPKEKSPNDIEGHSGLDPESIPPIDITGKVTDADGNPLAGATVKVKGSSKGTTTNNDGVFVLKAVDENATLEISFVGFETYTVNLSSAGGGVRKADGGGLGTIALKLKPESLNEVVINKGYYSEKQRLSTGNVTKVTSKDIEKSPVSNVLLALQGRVPGMEITPASGLPGSGITVLIRGRNSINNGNDPLYVVDGVPYLSQMLPGLTAITGPSGSNNPYSTSTPLNYLNPNDIESVEVLKDADATAIYGTRGANGVVLITTKKGKVGPIRVDVNVQQGWGKVTRFIPRLNTRQYLDMRYEALKNDGVDINTLTPDGRNYDLTLWDTTRYTDWNKKLIGGTAHYSNIQLSLYGGSNYVQYRLGYNYNKQTTTFPGSFGDPKGSLNFSVNSKSGNDKFKVQLSGNYQIDKNSLPYYDLSEFTDLAPNAPALYKADGSLNWADDPVTGYPTWYNPLAHLNLVYKRKVNNLVTNAVFSYELIHGLEMKANAGYTNMQSNEIKTVPTSAFAPIVIPFITREAQFATTQNDSWIVEPQLSYTTRLGGGQLNALVGTTIQENDSKGQSLTGQGFNNDLVMEDIKAAASVTIDNTIDAVYKYNALFGRINYNYGDKYLVNLTARRDGTSRFGPDKQFANFGAAGIGWVFSKENFVQKNFSFLSYGKIRGSYGTTGSDQVGDYRFMNLYNYVSYNLLYQNSLSLRLNGLFNPDLAWEETKKLEAAVELGFLQDNILLNASYYRNKCSNQLISSSLPETTGAGSIPANLDATMQNSGWEFSLNTTNFRGKDFRWTSSINLTIPKNELVSLSPKAITVDKRLVGHPLSTGFVYSFAGVDPATGIYQFYDGKGGLTFRPDTCIDATTKRLYSQKPLYTGVKYYGGFQNSFFWKNFQLDILFQFEKQVGQTNQRGSLQGAFYKHNTTQYQC
jgi:TonB-linked SusC/RagA family outer membrane protein